MGKAFNIWKKEANPLWLLLASMSEAGRSNLAKADLGVVNKYVEHFSSDSIPSLEDPQFRIKLGIDNSEFFSFIHREGVAYHSVFHSPYGEHNLYTQELIDQVGAAYGRDTVNQIYNHHITPEIAGNLMVAAAMSAVREMALVEYLHQSGELSDPEREFALRAVNNRMDRIGLNGIDRLFESRPEIERFVENDTKIINVGHFVGREERDEMTRAACYRAEMEKCKLFPNNITGVRQKIIGKDFPELENAKNYYVGIHVHDLPEPTKETRRKFKGYGIATGKGEAVDDVKHAAMLDQILLAMNKGDTKQYEEYIGFLLHDGIGINHPDRDHYANDLRYRMEHPDIIDVEVIDKREARKLPRKNTPLLGDDSGKKQSHVERLSSRDDAKGEDSHKKKEDGGTPAGGAADGRDKGSNTGAAIATIGGAAAVGLLLASGDKNKDGEDKEKNKGKALKFAALAGAAAVAVGGLIMWTKKPEFLYKPMKDLFRNLGFGRA